MCHYLVTISPLYDQTVCTRHDLLEALHGQLTLS